MSRSNLDDTPDDSSTVWCTMCFLRFPNQESCNQHFIQAHSSTFSFRGSLNGGVPRTSFPDVFHAAPVSVGNSHSESQHRSIQDLQPHTQQFSSGSSVYSFMSPITCDASTSSPPDLINLIPDGDKLYQLPELPTVSPSEAQGRLALTKRFTTSDFSADFGFSAEHLPIKVTWDFIYHKRFRKPTGKSVQAELDINGLIANWRVADQVYRGKGYKESDHIHRILSKRAPTQVIHEKHIAFFKSSCDTLKEDISNQVKNQFDELVRQFFSVLYHIVKNKCPAGYHVPPSPSLHNIAAIRQFCRKHIIFYHLLSFVEDQVANAFQMDKVSVEKWLLDGRQLEISHGKPHNFLFPILGDTLANKKRSTELFLKKHQNSSRTLVKSTSLSHSSHDSSW